MPPDAKRSAANDSSSYRLRLVDLPVGLLAYTASFLAAPSKALFAVALALDGDENLVGLPNEMSSAIVGNQWDTLDFGQIEEKLARKLSDAEVEKVLLCIDAVNNLKRLKLTKCQSITGVGLEPLRGSFIIEQIDLDTDCSPLWYRALELVTNVLPILDSIVEREGCTLMHLHFPSKRRNKRSFITPDFCAFIGRYNEMRKNQGTVHCLECKKILPDTGDGWIPDDGIIENTCYGCFKHYCWKCYIDSDTQDELCMMHECAICDRMYCTGCSFMKRCDCCGEDYCNDCCGECVKCNCGVCPRCVESDWAYICAYCDKRYCVLCDDEEEDIYSCSRCHVKSCVDCRLQRYQQGQLQCSTCIKQGVGMDEMLARKQLQEENEELKREVEHLESLNKQLKLENEELRSARSLV